MEKKDILQDIQKSWIHSHEEDTETEMVFRPADYDFPLSRGRYGFELKPNQKLIEINIAPVDGSEEDTGSWNVKTDRDQDLMLELNPSSSSPRNLHIKSVDKNCLVIEKD